MSEGQITTKDVVLEISRKVDKLVEDMQLVKVLAATVGTTVETQHDHETRIRTLEASAAESTGERKYKRWVFPAVWGAIVTAAAWVPDLFHGHIR